MLQNAFVCVQYLHAIEEQCCREESWCRSEIAKIHLIPYPRERSGWQIDPRLLCIRYI